MSHQYSQYSIAHIKGTCTHEFHWTNERLIEYYLNRRHLVYLGTVVTFVSDRLSVDPSPLVVSNVSSSCPYARIWHILTKIVLQHSLNLSVLNDRKRGVHVPTGGPGGFPISARVIYHEVTDVFLADIEAHVVVCLMRNALENKF